jgi:hypothetical protein
MLGNFVIVSADGFEPFDSCARIFFAARLDLKSEWPNGRRREGGQVYPNRAVR